LWSSSVTVTGSNLVTGNGGRGGNAGGGGAAGGGGQGGRYQNSSGVAGSPYGSSDSQDDASNGAPGGNGGNGGRGGPGGPGSGGPSVGVVRGGSSSLLSGPNVNFTLGTPGTGGGSPVASGAGGVAQLEWP
ncbi:MAG: hypothetical protein WBV82_17835, partial [Myxococcaceae bacterium]